MINREEAASKDMVVYTCHKQVMAKPLEKDGKQGYEVVYEDGYTSWSPKRAFEEGYTETHAADRTDTGRLVSWSPFK